MYIIEEHDASALVLMVAGSHYYSYSLLNASDLAYLVHGH